MLYTTKGIVFHYLKYGDNGAIVKIYTQKYGLQSYIINGVRGKKTKNKRAYLQPLSLVEISAQHKEKRNLQRLQSIKFDIAFNTIPFNIVKSTIVFFIAEVLYKAVKEEEPNDGLFHFLYHTIQILDLKEEGYVNFHLLFMVQLTKYLGFYPQFQGDKAQTPQYFDLQEGIFMNHTPKHKAFTTSAITNHLLTLAKADFDGILTVKLDNKSRKTVLNTLLDYYAFHLSNFSPPKTKEVLEQILNEDK